MLGPMLVELRELELTTAVIRGRASHPAPFGSGSFFSATSNDVWDLKALSAFLSCREMAFTAQLAFRRALMLLVWIRGSASSAYGFAGCRTDVGTMAKPSANVADVDLLTI